jgi:hypothetical protein
LRRRRRPAEEYGCHRRGINTEGDIEGREVLKDGYLTLNVYMWPEMAGRAEVARIDEIDRRLELGIGDRGVDLGRSSSILSGKMMRTTRRRGAAWNGGAMVRHVQWWSLHRYL